LTLVSFTPKSAESLILKELAGFAFSPDMSQFERITNCPNTESEWAEAQLLTSKGVRTCIPAPPAGDPPLAWEQCEMYYPLLSVHYDDHCLSYDAYGKNGFIERGGKWERTPNDTSPKYAGDYRKKTGINNGP
jgi:hypothetical protein